MAFWLDKGGGDHRRRESRLRQDIYHEFSELFVSSLEQWGYRTTYVLGKWCAQIESRFVGKWVGLNAANRSV